MWTVSELIEILKKHDQDSIVAIQFGYVSKTIKCVNTIEINQDERYLSEIKVKKKWKGDCPITFLTTDDAGVQIRNEQLYS